MLPCAPEGGVGQCAEWDVGSGVHADLSRAAGAGVSPGPVAISGAIEIEVGDDLDTTQAVGALVGSRDGILYP